MKKRNFIFVGIIALIMVASLSFAVYAAVSQSFNISNKITFVAEGVYYKVAGKVYFENEPSTILAEVDNLDFDPVTGETEWDIDDDFEFSFDKRTLIYEITIENHSEFEIIATLSGYDQDNDNDGINKFDFIENTVVGGVSTSNIPALTAGQPASAVTFILKTTVKTLENNFNFDNSFAVNLVEVE